MDIARAASELEEDLSIRQSELVFLENICEGLSDDKAKEKLRRAMLLMLYAHFEGFIKLALQIYCRHIDEAKVGCNDVEAVLATTMLTDAFRAFRDGNNAKKFLPKELHKLTDLRPIAIEMHFVERSRISNEKKVAIPEGYVDLESNLKLNVLRKNLFKLALPHDYFDDHASTLSELLERRNNIAHGSSSLGIDSKTYDKMKAVIEHITNEMRKMILDAIKKRSYLLAKDIAGDNIQNKVG